MQLIKKRLNVDQNESIAVVGLNVMEVSSKEQQ
jgi:hypothetical protein